MCQQALFLAALVLLNPPVHASLDSNKVGKLIVGFLDPLPTVEMDSRNQLRSHDEHVVANKKLADLHKIYATSTHRQLPGYFEDLNSQESFDQLFSTPIGQWEAGQGILQRWWPLQSYIVAAALLETDAIVVRDITLDMVVATEGTVVDAPVVALGSMAVSATFCSAFAAMSCFVVIAPMYLAAGTAVLSQESNAVGKDEGDDYHRQEGEMV